MLLAPTDSAVIRPSAMNPCGTGLAAQVSCLPRLTDPADAHRDVAGGRFEPNRTAPATTPPAEPTAGRVPPSKHPVPADRPAAVCDAGAAVWAAYVVQRALSA